ncbi:MAG: PAS domain S-box protein [Rhizobiaceae bacterium]|nr:PAS domain S-box protein [Rhizobiaceae bacterium]
MLDFEDIFHASCDEIVILSSDGSIVFVNEGWRRFALENAGDDNEWYLGKNYLTICSAAEGPSSAEASLVADGIRTVIAEGKPFRCEYPCNSPSEERWFELTANRFKSNGQIYAIVEHRNITTRYIAQHDAQSAFLQAEMLAAVVATSTDAILSFDLDCRLTTWNRAAQKLYGYSDKEAIGQRLDILYPDNWPTSVEEYRDRIIAGELQSFEAKRKTKQGGIVDVWVTCAPVRDQDGAIVAISNIHRDVTHIKLEAEAQLVAAQEVAHRSKNILSIVGAMQRQTARSALDLQDFLRKFDGRIAALSTSIDTLANNQWNSADLRHLVGAQIEPFISENENRLTISGPRIQLSQDAAQVIGMAIHELATNSVKHGAFKSTEGRVELTWQCRPTGETLIKWHETGKRFDTTPVGKGYGHTVLTRMATAKLGNEPSYRFDQDGVTWELTLEKRFLL